MDTENENAVEDQRRLILDELRRLAKWRSNDVVKLAFLDREDLEQMGKLDLTGLTELRRNANGTFEAKFVDQVKVLEMMKQLSEQESDGALKEFLEQLRGGGTP